MQDQVEKPSVRGNRRASAGGAAIGLGLLAKGSSALADQAGGVARGDIAILTFLAAIETIEADLWLQYGCESPRMTVRSEARACTARSNERLGRSPGVRAEGER
jgi:hypothetical protein